MIHAECPRSIGHLKADEYVWSKVNEAVEHPEVLIMGARNHVEGLRSQAQNVTKDNERIQSQIDGLLMERKWVITQARKGSISEFSTVH